MMCNEGKIDRALRVIAGVALIAWAVMSGNILGYIGIVPLLTGIFGFCPVYAILGLNSGCKINKE